jgi:hypothetical protein
MSTAQHATVEIQPEKYELYVEADRQIQKRLGQSPGPEFLMSLMLESEEDPNDLADIYLHTILQSVTA